VRLGSFFAQTIQASIISVLFLRQRFAAEFCGHRAFLFGLPLQSVGLRVDPVCVDCGFHGRVLECV
jgi:hypothetical protein